MLPTFPFYEINIFYIFIYVPSFIVIAISATTCVATSLWVKIEKHLTVHNIVDQCAE